MSDDRDVRHPTREEIARMTPEERKASLTAELKDLFQKSGARLVSVGPPRGHRLRQGETEVVLPVPKVQPERDEPQP